jgi:hypothetical protein
MKRILLCLLPADDLRRAGPGRASSQSRCPTGPSPRSRSVGRGGADRPTESPIELLAVTSARICNVCNDCPCISDREVVPEAPFRQHRDLPWHAIDVEVTSKPPQAIF